MVYANMALRARPERVRRAARGARRFAARSSPNCRLRGRGLGEGSRRRDRAWSRSSRRRRRRSGDADLAVAARGSSTWCPTPGDRRARRAAGGLDGLVDAVRGGSAVPVAVGFGIGTPEQAAAVGRIADGVIIGTRLVRAVAEADGAAEAAVAVGEFSAALATRWRRAGGPVG